MLIYPIVLFARGAALALCYPILQRMGGGCHWKNLVVSWWGGLRGSVGLALALQINHTIYSGALWGGPYQVEFITQYLPCRDIPHRMLMMTTVVVFTTVVINGTSMAWLMKLLKMTELPRDRKFMIKAAYTRIEDMTRDFVEELKTKSQHHGVNWRVVETERLTDKGKNCEFESCERDSFMSAWQEAFNMER